MRISFILSSLWLSGGMRVIVECANRLATRGHQVAMVIPGGTNDPDMRREVTTDVLESLVARREHLSVAQMVRLSWSLAQTVPPSDVIVSTHTPTTVAGLLAGRLLNKGRLVWLYQDYREMFRERPIEDWLVRNAFRWHELALVPSDYSQEELEKYAYGKKVVVMGYGLSHPEHFRPLPAEERARDAEVRAVLCLTDMRPRKGLYDFLEASAQVYEQLRDIKLWIVSKEPCQVETHVPFEYIYRPTRAELGHLYATCALFVLASWWESFGLPPLEAMASGAPVIVTDTRGAREYARPEENCLMVPPRDPQALAKAMLRVLTDDTLADKLRRNGPPMAARFDWERVVDRFEGALDTLFEK
jgi:glycosyltransferase involved in cell wall biosynthesis